MPTISHDSSAFALMCSHLQGAVHELFGDYDIVLQPVDAARKESPDDQRAGMAVIGFAGQGVRGALVLMAPESAVGTWMTAAGVPDGDVADTLGEFSNMLLGRLKARLLPLGISILATTPTSMLGCGLRLSDPPGPSGWSAFDGADWRLLLRLDADFDPGFKPVATQKAAWHANAGDAIDFDSPAAAPAQEDAV